MPHGLSTSSLPQASQGSPQARTVPLGWMSISTGRSKVCLLAKVMIMLLAEHADGAASARISWVGLSTPEWHRKAG